MNQPASSTPSSFRLLLVPGVNPDRWLRVWAERLPDHPVELVHAAPRDQLAVLHDGRADAGLVRLPTDRTGLQVVELWTERTVVVVPRDHVLTVVEEVDPADLADETLLVPADDLIGWADAPGDRFAGDPPATTADALDLVAAGIGALLLPSRWPACTTARTSPTVRCATPRPPVSGSRGCGGRTTNSCRSSWASSGGAPRAAHADAVSRPCPAPRLNRRARRPAQSPAPGVG
ncbi:LysR substrate-binding domain-containing protein [Cellulomonas soli]